MSEFRTEEQIAPWLEMELARHLSPVAAPEALWNHVQAQAYSRRESSMRWGWWAVAATVLLIMGVAWQINPADGPAGVMEKLAEQELRTGSARLDFRSDDPMEIRTWLNAKANIDIELPGERSGPVRLLGARLIPFEGASIAAVCYTVDNRPATLVVSKKRGVASTTGKHSFSRVESAGGARLFTWSMREQVYTIASAAKDPQAACLLCHLRHG